MEQIIVSLSEARSKKDLIKLVKEEQLSETFDSLFLYMLKNEQDELNAPYSSDKEMTVEALRGAYDAGKKDNQMVLTYISSVDKGRHKVRLSDVVCKQPGILHEGDELFGDVAANYKRIELCSSYDPVGGN